jgi:hypothetical protein
VANKKPNRLLLNARRSLASPNHCRLPMSRSEMADAINAALHLIFPDRKDLASYYVDHRWIGKLERGEHHWASPERRAALRAVTGIATDRELGLHKPRNSDRSATSNTLPHDAGNASSRTRQLSEPGETERRKNIGIPAAHRSVEAITIAPPVHAVPQGPTVSPRPSGLTHLPTEQRPSAVGNGFADATVTGDLDMSSGDWNSFSIVTRMLAQQRQTVAPEALLRLVEAHRDCLSALFRKARPSDAVHADLGAMLGEASIVASRLWSAQGNRVLALAHCASARELADRLGDPRVGAIARIFESNLHSEAAMLIEANGDVMIGLRLLEEATAASSYLSPAARARVAAEQAQTYAALQLPREAHAALERARTAADGITPEDRTGLFSDWSTSRLDVYEGTCLLLVGQPAKAVAALEPVVTNSEHDRDNTNVVLAAKVDLAGAYAAVGELEESCRLLGDTFEQLTTIGNLRGIGRAHRARERLAQWNGESPVRDLDARMFAA